MNDQRAHGDALRNEPDPQEVAPDEVARVAAARRAFRETTEAGTATPDDIRVFLGAVRGYASALGFDDPKVRQRIAQGRYRAPGFVVEDEVGYDRKLAKRSVGPGWHGLIDEVFDYKDVQAPSVRIVQVKEKYASLTVYIEGHGEGSTRLAEFVDSIERRSETVCEECGAPGFVREGPWLKTLCDAHADGRPRAQGW